MYQESKIEIFIQILFKIVYEIFIIQNRQTEMIKSAIKKRKTIELSIKFSANASFILFFLVKFTLSSQFKNDKKGFQTK